MLFSLKTRNIIFKVFAVLAYLAGTYHFAGVFYKVDESPIWRHLLFVGINIFCVYGFLKRPKCFVFFVALLFIQQCYSHGTYMLNTWIKTKQIHWISVFDLLLLPIGLICLIEDYKLKNKKLSQ
jgi:hypothetical protein